MTHIFCFLCVCVSRKEWFREHVKVEPRKKERDREDYRVNGRGLN